MRSKSRLPKEVRNELGNFANRIRLLAVAVAVAVAVAIAVAVAVEVGVAIAVAIAVAVAVEVGVAIAVAIVVVVEVVVAVAVGVMSNMQHEPLDRGTSVAFRWQGRMREGAKVLVTYPEVKDAVRVEWREQDYIVKREEVLTEDEMEQQRKIDIAARNRQEYGDLMDAWAKGLRTNKELAEATNTPSMGIASRIRAAKRRGLLK